MEQITDKSSFVKAWERANNLPISILQGTDALKNEKFLPRHPLETSKGYKVRTSQARLVNYYKQTATSLTGSVFGREIAIEADDNVVALLGQTSVGGKSITDLSRKVFFDGISTGMSGLLIDAPAVDNNKPLSIASATEQGIRPYMRAVHGSEVVGARFDSLGNCIDLRLQATVVKPDGNYGDKVIQQIRHYLHDGTWELWDVSEFSAELVDEGQSGYHGVPFVFYSPGDTILEAASTAPLMPLAELQLTHYQSYTDQRNILSVARVPILFGRHIKIDKMPVGVSTIVVANEDNADLDYVEPACNGIKAGAEDIKDIEHKIALYGLQQLVPRVGNQTATEKEITQEDVDSNLRVVARDYQSAVSKAVEIFGEMLGGADIKATVNMDFASAHVGLDLVNSLNALAASEIISKTTGLEELQARDFFKVEKDRQDIEAEIAQERRTVDEA